MLRFWRPPRTGLLVIFAVWLAFLYLFGDYRVAIFAAITGVLGFAYGRHSCNDHDLEGFH